MGFRITTNMMMNTYRKNLQGSNLKLSDSMDKVMTTRNFNSYAEDPAAAGQQQTHYGDSQTLLFLFGGSFFFHAKTSFLL